jgi:hypothetical protein
LELFQVFTTHTSNLPFGTIKLKSRNPEWIAAFLFGCTICAPTQKKKAIWPDARWLFFVR